MATLSSAKIGDADVDKVYVGDTLIYEAIKSNYQITPDCVKSYWDDVVYDNDDYTYTLIDNYLGTTAYRKDAPKAVIVVLSQKYTANVVFSLDVDFVNVVQTISIQDSRIVEIYNLIPKKRYYYKVVENGITKESGYLDTDGSVRFIKADSICNCRDIGGKAANGMYVKYGLVFRGSEMNGEHNIQISDGDIIIMRDIVGIKAELDFRNQGETDFDTEDTSDDITTSALGNDIKYDRVSLGSGYVSGLTTYSSKYKEAFQTLLSNLKNNKPTHYHCWAGADRTGTFTMLILGVLGVSENDLAKEFETTSFSTESVKQHIQAASQYRPRKEYYSFTYNQTIAYIKALNGATLKDKFVTYMLSIGVTASEIEDFESIMIE